MLVSDSGQCQPLKYLKTNRETAPQMLARLKDVDQNGLLQTRSSFDGSTLTSAARIGLANTRFIILVPAGRMPSLPATDS